MTTRDAHGTRSDNSSPARPDESTVLEVIREHDGLPLERLAGLTSLPDTELRYILDELQEQNLIEVTPKFRSVFVAPTDADRGRDRPDLIADGGAWVSVLDAITRSPDSIAVTEADFYAALSNRRRRRLLRLLAGLYDGADDSEATYLEVQEVAAVFARSIHDDPSDEQTHRLYVSLTQTHLPKLDEAGLVECYSRVQKVRGTDAVVPVADVMSRVADLCEGPTWYRARPPERRSN